LRYESQTIFVTNSTSTIGPHRHQFITERHRPIRAPTTIRRSAIPHRETPRGETLFTSLGSTRPQLQRPQPPRDEQDAREPVRACTNSGATHAQDVSRKGSVQDPPSHSMWMWSPAPTNRARTGCRARHEQIVEQRSALARGRGGSEQDVTQAAA
jgi:hypothetical protein